MIDRKELLDPVTKRCCPNRCAKKINGLMLNVNNLMIQIVRILVDKTTSIEERYAETVQPIKTQLETRIAECEMQLGNIYRKVQSDLIQRYIPVSERVEAILNSKPETTTEEPGSDEKELEETTTPIQSSPSEPSQALTPSSTPSSTPMQAPSPVALSKKVEDCCESVSAIAVALAMLTKKIETYLGIKINNLEPRVTPAMAESWIQSEDNVMGPYFVPELIEE